MNELFKCYLKYPFRENKYTGVFIQCIGMLLILHSTTLRGIFKPSDLVNFIIKIVIISIGYSLLTYSNDILICQDKIKENNYLFSLPIDNYKFIIISNLITLINILISSVISVVFPLTLYIYIFNKHMHINSFTHYIIALVLISLLSLSLGNTITIYNHKNVKYDFWKKSIAFFGNFNYRGIVPLIISPIYILILFFTFKYIEWYMIFIALILYLISINKITNKLNKQSDFLEEIGDV